MFGDPHDSPVRAHDAFLVTSCVECEAEIIGMTYRSCEYRNDNGGYRFDPLYECSCFNAAASG